MASGGRRRKRRGGGAARPNKAKKRTKYLSLSRIIVKAEVQTPPRTPVEDDDDHCAPASSPSSPPFAQEEEQAEVKQEDGGGGLQPDPPFALLLHNEASTLFAALPAPSLSDILGAGSDESPSPSASASPAAAGLTGAEEEDLARRALRGRERWVYCCASSPSTTGGNTATSSASPCSSSAASTGASARAPLLKLDYDEILAVWADRGSLYIGRAKQEEPEPELDNVLVEVEPAAQQQHPVVKVEQRHHPAVKEEPVQHPSAACSTPPPPGTEWSGRAESVRRYREKRRNRLFAHRIRYEVRHVNAVKRPRFKGRFIKHEEIEV